jgi:hypothetical protein
MKQRARDTSDTCLRMELGELTIAICRILVLSKRSKDEVNDLAMGCGSGAGKENGQEYQFYLRGPG